MNEHLTKYINNGNNYVDGWLLKIAISLIIELNEFQCEKSIEGPVCEIGVHHGRLLILLSLMSLNRKLTVGYDLFENQLDNEDNSGYGNKDIFIKNAQKHGCNLDTIKAISKNSTMLSKKDIIDDCEGNPRFFSIDGGHTSYITYNDLKLAGETLVDNGIVILDDYFNESWPEVSEGTNLFMRDFPNTLIPFAIGGNKIFFTNNSKFAKDYLQHLLNSKNLKRNNSKKSSFLGYPILIYWKPEIRTRIQSYFVHSKLWIFIKKVGLGNFVSKLFRGILAQK